MVQRNLSVELRPQTLDDFIGCESIIGSIKEGIKQGRVDSTYVLTGPAGTGKTSLARAIIKYVNGKQDYYDIIEPDTSDLGIDDIRPIINRANYAPQIGKYKGIILDEAHKLNHQAITILLKAIEEPCSSTIWFICSSEAGKLPESIRRRGSFYVMQGMTTVDEISKLIDRALAFTGLTGNPKYSNHWLELAKALMANDTTSPGLIIRAIEKWITGIPASEAALVSEVTSVDTLAIARGVAQGNWSAVQQLLQGAPRSAARDVRAAVAGYFRAILLKESAKSKRAERCVWAIQQLTELANQNQFEEGLIWAATCASIYTICVGQQAYINKENKAC